MILYYEEFTDVDVSFLCCSISSPLLFGLLELCIYSYILDMLQIYTSAKIIQLNEWGCRDGMDHAKNHGNKEIPLAMLSRILAQSCVTCCLNM